MASQHLDAVTERAIASMIHDIVPNTNVTIRFFTGNAGVAQCKLMSTGNAVVEFNMDFLTWTGDKQRAILGLLAHELSHIKYDSFSLFPVETGGRNSSVYGLILNIVEDGRIEHKLSQDFPQYYSLLEWVKHKEDVGNLSIKFRVATPQCEAIARVLKGFYYVMRQGDYFNTTEGLLAKQLALKHVRDVSVPLDSMRASHSIYDEIVIHYGAPTNVRIHGMVLPLDLTGHVPADIPILGYK